MTKEQLAAPKVNKELLGRVKFRFADDGEVLAVVAEVERLQNLLKIKTIAWEAAIKSMERGQTIPPHLQAALDAE